MGEDSTWFKLRAAMTLEDKSDLFTRHGQVHSLHFSVM